MKSISQLTEFYYSALYPRILELEKKRKDIVHRITIIFVILATVNFSLFHFFTNKQQHIDLFVILFFVIPFLAISSFLYKFLTKDYVLSFKTEIIEPLLKEIDQNLRYNPTHKIDQKTFTNSDIFKETIDRYNGSDYVSGSVDGVPISFCYLHVEKKKRIQKVTLITLTFFKGFLLLLRLTSIF
jgi:hypothetical protein